jgi:hypothetical protein
LSEPQSRWERRRVRLYSLEVLSAWESWSPSKATRNLPNAEQMMAPQTARSGQSTELLKMMPKGPQMCVKEPLM